MDAESELIELCNVEDSEKEKEEKKEKDDKIKNFLYLANSASSIASLKFSHAEASTAIPHLEITTPPPEPFQLFS